MGDVKEEKNWFRGVFEQAFSSELLSSEAILEVVTPEELAANMPAEVMSKLLRLSFDERPTPAAVIECVGIDAILTHIPKTLLWKLLESSFANIDMEKNADYCRYYLGSAVDRGVRGEELVEAVGPVWLCKNFKREALCEILIRSLDVEKVTPAVVFEVAEVDGLLEVMTKEKLVSLMTWVGERTSNERVIAKDIDNVDTEIRRLADQTKKRLNTSPIMDSGRSAYDVI